MKFSINSGVLLSLLMYVGKAIGSNPVLPILEDFLFDIKGNELTITATDMNITIQQSTTVTADSDMSVAIPAKLLIDTLKALPNQPLTFEVAEDTLQITITSAYGKYKMVGELGKDFPLIPEKEKVGNFELKGELFATVIGLTAFATSNEELRPAMTGLYVEGSGKQLICVATDAHKLSKVVVTLDTSVPTGKFIIPKKSLSILKELKGSLTCSFNQSHAFFQAEDTEIICRLIDARYPDYNAVIPTDNPHTLQAVSGNLTNSLKRIAIYANKTTNQVRLQLNSDTLELQAEDLDFSNAAQETISCNYSGDPMLVGYNARILVDCLSALSAEEVVLRLSSPTKAALLEPAEQEEGLEVTMLAMPVMISN